LGVNPPAPLVFGFPITNPLKEDIPLTAEVTSIPSAGHFTPPTDIEPVRSIFRFLGVNPPAPLIFGFPTAKPLKGDIPLMIEVTSTLSACHFMPPTYIEPVHLIYWFLG
jgi:hypothetical protein